MDAGDAEEPAIQLSFPPNVPVSVLIDYVSQRLGQNILYDEQVGRAQVTLQSPAPISPDALLPLLETILRSEGFALIDLPQPGWKQVVPLEGMAQVAELPDDEAELPGLPGAGGRVVTHVFRLEHAAPAAVEAVLRPFLTPQGSQLVSDPERGLIILTDFADVVEKASTLVELLDAPGLQTVTEFLAVEHVPASTLAQELTRLLGAAGRGGAAGGGTVQVVPQERTNQVVLVGSAGAVERAEALAAELDVDLGMETRVFSMQFADPQRLDTLTRQLIDPAAVDRLYRSSIDADGSILVVTATPPILEQVEALRRRLDTPAAESSSPIRFYKLENANAADVLATIRAIEGTAGLEGLMLYGEDGAAVVVTEPEPGAAALSERIPDNPTEFSAVEATPDPLGGIGPPRAPLAVEGRNVTVAADENTNTLIVIGDASVQRIYATLIERLDKRRPQVLVEATIVTIDTTNSASLGVEIKAGDDSGENQTFAFSRFGLSEIGDDGRLELIPGLGFNGAVLQADVADIVIAALKSDARAKVVSAPKILVNDNATGNIASVSEQPVTSINQGQNTDTVTFSQFVSAGTTITVTPHIAEGDFLRLEFEVALESFQGDGGAGLPPPKQSNTVSSEVTIPDGATIVVGGINRRDNSDSVSRIPILGELPLLEYAFSSRTKTDSESTLFVFLRPLVLRDDRFADLKYLSGQDLQRADLPGVGGDPDGFPESAAMLVR